MEMSERIGARKTGAYGISEQKPVSVNSMGNQLIKDGNGKMCAAKTAFMITLLTCLAKIIIHGVAPFFGFEAPAPDYTGMAALLSPLAAVYWGRNHTKANQNAK